MRARPCEQSPDSARSDQPPFLSCGARWLFPLARIKSPPVDRNRRAEPDRIRPALPVDTGRSDRLDVVPAIRARLKQQQAVRNWIDGDEFRARPAMPEAT